MARIKHTSAILQGGPRGAQKQLKLIKNLNVRMNVSAWTHLPILIFSSAYSNKIMFAFWQEKYGAKKMMMATKNKKSSSSGKLVPAEEGVGRKKRRWKSGTVARREIRKMTRTTNLLFPKSTFSRQVCVLQVSKKCRGLEKDTGK